MQHYQQYLTNFCQERGDRDRGCSQHSAIVGFTLFRMNQLVGRTAYSAAGAE
jgi:hypothetical protein